jgi:sugar phosphate isomerase/epimerase
MRRREMLSVLGGVAGGLALAPSLGRAAEVLARTGAATRLKKIDIQLYSLRSLMAKDFEGTLAALGKMGYREVEFAGLYDHGAKAVRGMLDSHQLSSPSSHIDIARMRTNPGAVFEEAHVLGNEWVVVPFLMPDERKTLDDWKKRADELNGFATKAKAAGLKFAYHNHDFEFTMLDGKLPFDILAQNTDAKLVQFELDLFWATKAGADPLALFKRWPGRFPMVHVKDRNAAGEMVSVGAGILPFGTWFKQAKEAGLQHYVVEHDQPPVPLEFAQASHDWLAKLEF